MKRATAQWAISINSTFLKIQDSLVFTDFGGNFAAGKMVEIER